MNKQAIHIYCDGGYEAHNDTGGWAYIIYQRKTKPPQSIKRLSSSDYRELKRNSGWQKHTSSLEMELQAAHQALLAIQTSKEIPTDITLFTDSRIIIEGLEQKYSIWQTNNWQVKSGKTVVYKELWQALANLTNELNVHWQWVKAHSGIHGNVVVDELATQARLDKKLYIA
ncbi:ribonuclease H family protein [Thiomicrorhabdus sediminis]|uniref:ribonuclease H n=1 Tax=Thiomicrorhabdus sediminis TaxID=2580412 RepID=A0A4P9K681_9GAMM|nr:ribonuclease H [Thiomicrorhabdus sediminis]QCU90331.1 ribonuclease HI [Thiomicrorhabdus sediminis]